MINQLFTIGKLAQMTGVHVETIRYYQRRQLLREPVKPAGSVRHYTEAEALRIQFIKSAQRLGFSLDEIAVLLRLEDGTHCKDAQGIAELKLDSIDRKIAELKSMRKALAGLVMLCEKSRGDVHCPLIESIRPAGRIGKI